MHRAARTTCAACVGQQEKKEKRKARRLLPKLPVETSSTVITVKKNFNP
jgi:hypothetical protein